LADAPPALDAPPGPSATARDWPLILRFTEDTAMAEAQWQDERLLGTHGRWFHGFMPAVKWFCIHIATIIVFLVISFRTSAGLGWGVVDAAVVFAAGVYAMTHGLAHSTEDASIHGDALPPEA
jgi:hypothetical protein